jgi:hypothetical protein
MLIGCGCNLSNGCVRLSHRQEREKGQGKAKRKRGRENGRKKKKETKTKTHEHIDTLHSVISSRSV